MSDGGNEGWKIKKASLVLFTIALAGLMLFIIAGCSSNSSSTGSEAAGAGTGESGISGGTSGIGGSGGGGVAGGTVAKGGSGGTLATGGTVAKGGFGGTVTTGGKGGTSGSGGTAGSGGSAGSTEQKSEGCGKEPPATTATSVNFQGVDRTIIVDAPASYDKNRAYPLIFSWHGMSVSVDMFRGYLNLPAAVGADGFVVSLECAGGSSGSWDATNDPLFFDALVEKFESEYCIDKHRIFSAGHSMGGFFNHTLACHRAGVLRGAAPLAASATGLTGCGKLAIWYSQGESDTVGNGPATRDFWVKNNGCDASKGTPVAQSPCAGGTVTCACTDYTVGCEQTPVRYCTFPGGHEIPTFIGSGVWSFFKGLN